MNELLTSAIFGLVGGLARSIVGLLKHYRINHKTKFKLNYLLITLLGSAIIGSFSSLILFSDFKLSLIAGYVGIDIIENLVKAYRKKISF
jgi:fluoride ion exporter CrcB/FEX